MIIFKELEWKPEYVIEVFDSLAVSNRFGRFTIPARFLESSRWRNQIGEIYWEIGLTDRGFNHIIEQGCECKKRKIGIREMYNIDFKII